MNQADREDFFVLSIPQIRELQRVLNGALLKADCIFGRGGDRIAYSKTLELRESLIEDLTRAVNISETKGRCMTTTEKLEQLKMTPEQDKALIKVFERHVRDSEHPDFANLAFNDWVVKDVFKAPFDDCIMAAVPHMWLGIETDGYTHS